MKRSAPSEGDSIDSLEDEESTATLLEQSVPKKTKKPRLTKEEREEKRLREGIARKQNSTKKRKKKKQEAFQEKERQKQQRKRLFDTLKRHSVTSDQLKVMQATTQLGKAKKNESAKAKKRRAQLEQQLMGESITHVPPSAMPQRGNSALSWDEAVAALVGEDKDLYYSKEDMERDTAQMAPKESIKPSDEASKSTEKDESSTAGGWNLDIADKFLFIDDEDEEDEEDGEDGEEEKKEEDKSSTTIGRDSSSSNDGDRLDAIAPLEDGMEAMMRVVRQCTAAEDSSSSSSSISRESDGESLRVMREKYVSVDRLPEMQRQREALPIYMEEQRIMEVIGEHDVVILCGETGSGKTTQVPQFLYEAGYGSVDGRQGKIGITQPRRVAAVAMASRVKEELNLKHGQVAHQVRYDSAVRENTLVKFMTDGILLREIQSDFLLRDYSCIILDEAHERNLNTDVLIGLLSRIVPLRRRLFHARSMLLRQQQQQQRDGSTESGDKGGASTHESLPKLSEETIMSARSPLKLIIMSATLRVTDFTANVKLFPSGPPPVVKVEARQHPVTVHFNRRTPSVGEYVQACFHKVCKIHAQLPHGGILVFLTGRQEIEHMCRLLREQYPSDAPEWIKQTRKSAFLPKSATTKVEERKKSSGDADGPHDMGNEEEGKKEEEKNIKDEDEDDDHIREDGGYVPLHVLPLYSALSQERQQRVFHRPPDGHRLVVVATNVAETSVTIPHISYVVDCGKSKVRHHDKRSGISSFKVDWISKAAANQRAGRAGRTGPGHCYRIYSSAVFNDVFPAWSIPEALSMPVEGVVLSMKLMGIDRVQAFPFPSPPGRESLSQAHRTLSRIGALCAEEELPTPMEVQHKSSSSSSSSSTTTGDDEAMRTNQEENFLVPMRITALGRAMAAFPVAPRFAKILALAQAHAADGSSSSNGSTLLSQAIAVVASLTVRNPMLHADISSAASHASDALPLVPGESSASREKRILTSALNRARKAHKRFQDPTSDVLSLLRAVGGYAYARQQSVAAAVEFCTEHFLGRKGMAEIHDLRRQLEGIVTRMAREEEEDEEEDEEGEEDDQSSRDKDSNGGDGSVVGPLQPPSRKQQRAIKQLIAAGFIDQVARVDAQRSTDGYIKKTGKTVWRYRTCTTGEEVFIHPSSSLFGESHEYVVYTELTRSEIEKPKNEDDNNDDEGDDGDGSNTQRIASKTYMRGVTAIRSKWLAELGSTLCHYSAPLETPTPKYNSQKDGIEGFVKVQFGLQAWSLPLHRKMLDPSTPFTRRWFVRALLEGDVLAHLSIFKDVLVHPTSSVTSHSSNPSRYVLPLLQLVHQHDVSSKADLMAQWERDNAFMMREYAQWVPKRYHSMVKAMWKGLNEPFDASKVKPLT